MIIDAHHHVWDPASGHVPGLSPGHEMYRRFGIEDVAEPMREAGVTGSVLVQSANSTDDTSALLAIAATSPLIAGVVGWVPLHEPEAVAAELSAPRADRLCGVRHLVQLDPDPDFLVSDEVIAGLEVVADVGLVLDIAPARPALLEQAIFLVERVAGLRIVIDHLGKPPLREGGWEPWASLVARCAQSPAIAIKLSGLLSGPGPPPVMDGLVRCVEHVLAGFGAARVLWGSDWPLGLRGGSYQDGFSAAQACIRRVDPAVEEVVFGDAAVSVYNLDARLDGKGSSAPPQ